MPTDSGKTFLCFVRKAIQVNYEPSPSISIMVKPTATAANGSGSSSNTGRTNSNAARANNTNNRNKSNAAATNDRNKNTSSSSTTTTTSNNNNNHQHIAHELLSQAFALPEDVERIFVEKVQRRPLLLRPSTTSQQQQQQQRTDARERRRQRRQERKGQRRKKLQRQQEEGIVGGGGSGGGGIGSGRGEASEKPRPLSARDKRRLHIYDVPREAQKYAIYEPLHRMWVGYIWEVLGGPAPAAAATGGGGAQGGGGGGGEGGGGGGEVGAGAGVGVGAELSLPITPAVAAAALCSADFHGAELEVVRARCVSRVGVRGIVVKDTKFTFELVTRRDELKGMDLFPFLLFCFSLSLFRIFFSPLVRRDGGRGGGGKRDVILCV